MQPTIITKDIFRSVGISVTTRNDVEFSANGKIPHLWQTYFKEDIMNQIPNKTGAEIIALYSNYESDETGSYTYTIGNAVSAFEPISENMTLLSVPKTTYAVFTTRRGKIPEVVPEMWAYIWEWSKENQRAFTVDFELYDERATNPDNAQVDIYIALER
ncbi:DNA-binding protein [Bacillus manliponensis]|uniref:DNA-binding protein n=1 Tax=Bacillus manliponensis TaxID=574376 RepID=A0A073JUC8_9BACI|nr:GyrI-like domain-containing protein [Bacillus manliponensis]KEK17827.1 DNA-binding protein [Bacillus manliponensis]